MNGKYTCKRINKMADDPVKFLAECSSEYHRIINVVAKKIYANTSVKIVTLAGPSSSGKTTTAAFLSEAINGMGGRAYTISLDDFYHPRSVGYPLDENGKPDYECVEALDVEFLHSKLRELIESGKAEMPAFDFKTGERIQNAKTVELKENDVVIVEGLHALNPVITNTLDKQSLFKLYVSVSTRVYEEDGNVFLSKRDLRFIRRMVRDFSFRSSSVDKTFDLWQSVLKGEDKYLFPYEYLADIRIDSFHPCEPCVFAARATELLRSTKNGTHKERAELLIEKLNFFIKTDYSLLPHDSLLREFTG